MSATLQPCIHFSGPTRTYAAQNATGDTEIRCWNCDAVLKTVRKSFILE